MSEMRQMLELDSTLSSTRLEVAGDLDADSELELEMGPDRDPYEWKTVWLSRDDVVKLRDHLSAVLGDGGGHRC